MGETVVIRVNSPSVVITQEGNVVSTSKPSTPTVTILDNSKVVSMSAPGPQGPPGVSGSGGMPYTEKTSDYYIQVGIDGFIGANAINGDMTIFLPISNLSNQGNIFAVKQIDSSGHRVTVSTQLGQMLDNINSLIVYDLGGEEYNFMSTGVGWKVF